MALVVFVSIILFLIFFLVLYFISRSGPKESKTRKTAASQPQERLPLNTSDDPLLYKEAKIRSFNLKGMYYSDDIAIEEDNGSFIGYAECEDSYHDMYAVAIFNNEGKQLGYTPKNNKRLNTSIEKWHNGRVFCWGSLEYDDYNGKWYGGVHIPVGYSEEKINDLKRIFAIHDRIHTTLKKADISNDEYIDALNLYLEREELAAYFRDKNSMYFHFPKTVLPTLSTRLEKEKEWSKLLNLQKYQVLINELSDRYKKSLNRRIEKARSLIDHSSK